MPPRKKKAGRPRVKIDLELVEDLANIHCTIKEISGIIGVPATTLQGRDDFRAVYEKGIENGKKSLRRSQFKLSQTNATMAIWLGKQYLGQRDYNQYTEAVEGVSDKLKAIADAITESDTNSGSTI